MYFRQACSLREPAVYSTVTAAPLDSTHPALDAATCQAALRRLRFEPAVDRAGRPVDAWTDDSQEDWHRNKLPPGRGNDAMDGERDD